MNDSSEVLWVHLLPEGIKGGPQSEHRKKVERAKAQAASAMQVQARPVAASLPSSPTAPVGMMGGGDVGAYTGDSGKEVVADKVANTKQLKDHEGEFYITAPVVNILGGPDATRQTIEDLAAQKVSDAGNSFRPVAPDQKLITSEKNPSSNIIEGHFGEGAVAPIRTSFGPGGSVYGEDNLNPDGTVKKSDSYQRESDGTTPPPVGAGATVYGEDSLGVGGKQTNTALGTTGLVDPLRRFSTGQPVQPVAPVQTTQQPAQATNATNMINQGTDFLSSLAAGDNKVVDAMVNDALNKHGANTAGGKAELQMRMTAQGLSPEAQAAGMESYDRSARIGANTIQAQLSQQAMQQAQTAAQSLISTGQSERSFETNRQQEQLAAALQSGNFDTYREVYKQIYNKDIDTSTFQKAFNDQQFNNANEALDNVFVRNLNADINEPNVRNYLKDIWKYSGGQGEPTEDWMKLQLESRRDQFDSSKIYINSMTPDAILRDWFGGDQSALDDFAFNNQRGAKAFADYLPTLVTGGAVKTVVGADGKRTFTIDWENEAIKFYLNRKEPDIAVTQPLGASTVGATVKVGTNDYKVEALGADGTPSIVSFNGQNYDVTKDAQGTVLRRKTGGVTTGAEGAFIVNGVQGKVDGTGELVVTKNGKQYATIGGQEVEVVYDASTNKITPKSPLQTPGQKIPDLTWDGRDVSFSSVSGYGTTSDGRLVKLTPSGNTFTVLELSPQEVASLLSSTDPDIVKTVAKDPQSFKLYRQNQGATPLDSKIVTKMIEAGNVDAVNYAVGQVDAGNYSYVINPNVKAALTAKAKAYAHRADFGDNKNLPPLGTIINRNGNLYRLTSGNTTGKINRVLNGENGYSYLYTLESIDGGTNLGTAFIAT